MPSYADGTTHSCSRRGFYFFMFDIKKKGRDLEDQAKREKEKIDKIHSDWLLKENEGDEG